jgi:hypothetical protein
MIAVQVVLAIAACALIACVLHYFFTAAFRPRRFLEFTNAEPIPAKKWIYFLAVIIGCCIILFPGFDALLSWMPLSWGRHGEDGGFNPARHTIAAFLTSLAFPLLSYVESSARREVANEDLRARVIQLEKELIIAKHASSDAT